MNLFFIGYPAAIFPLFADAIQTKFSHFHQEDNNFFDISI